MRATTKTSLAAGLLAATAIADDIVVSQNKRPLVEDSDYANVQWTYPGFALDGPRVQNVNGTTYDWWYFDTVSADIVNGDNSSAACVFHDGTSGGFQNLPDIPQKLHVYMTGTWPNGSNWRAPLQASSAVVSAHGQGSDGYWPPYGRWGGSVESGEWLITFESEQYGVNGTMRYEQIAPPHFACGVPEEGITEALVPHVGWLNTVPDAIAHVEFDINGTRLEFEGVGYHDKNWGDQPFFNESVNSWYWGHARVGPYSVVWFDTETVNDGEMFSGYVARDGVILSSSCEEGSAFVRPWGGEDTYPPPRGLDYPAGYFMTFGDVDGRTFNVNVTTTASPALLVSYQRFLGIAEGWFDDDEEETFRGAASYEQFKSA